jgi:hypothetical protein
VRTFLSASLVLAALAAAVVVLVGPASGERRPVSVVRDAARGDIRPGTIATRDANGTTGTKVLPFISDGTLAAAQDAVGVGSADERLEGADAADNPGDLALDGGVGTNPGSLGCSRRDRGRSGRGDRGDSGNVRVNQDCTFRRQAEEDIAYDPTDPSNLIAGQNDSRVGFNQCGVDFSVDNGQHWGDYLPPFRQRLNDPTTVSAPVPGDANRHTILGGPGTQHTYDAGSDPTMTFGADGRSYFSCVAFDINSNASLLYVTASPKGSDASFMDQIPAAGRRFIVAEDDNAGVFHDKNMIVADANRASPNRNNVYVTWTVFGTTCGGTGTGYCSSPIFGSMSTDGGMIWSTPELVSGRNAALCVGGGTFTNDAADGDKCNFDQGSDPATLPNGDLFVVFNNGNTPSSVNQQLGVLCHPTGSSPAGTARLNCAAPTKVGNDVATGEPQCDFGRGPEECIPGAFIRTNDYPRIVTNTQNNHLYVTWQDYRHGEFDIQLTESPDGGVTWLPEVTVNPDRGLDHYFAAVDQSPQRGDRVGDSYYRTERVPNEGTTPPAGFTPGVDPGVGQGNSDYVLAGGTALDAPYDFTVVSPVFPPPDGIQAGFNGDYSGLVINRGEEAHPIWSDTRNVNAFPESSPGTIHDEDIFTDTVDLPNGRGRPSTGGLGRR